MRGSISKLIAGKGLLGRKRSVHMRPGKLWLSRTEILFLQQKLFGQNRNMDEPGENVIGHTGMNI